MHVTDLRADSICVHQRFQAFSFIILWFFLVFFRNCFRFPEDMYSVMKMTLALFSFTSAQYLKLDNVQVLQLDQVVKHRFDFLLFVRLQQLQQ